MSGGTLDLTHAVRGQQQAHACSPPDPVRHEHLPAYRQDPDYRLTQQIVVAPPGARWHCDCGRVWISALDYCIRGRPTIVWERETRRQRRQRLGLRWWQRSVETGARP